MLVDCLPMIALFCSTIGYVRRPDPVVETLHAQSPLLIFVIAFVLIVGAVWSIIETRGK